MVDDRQWKKAPDPETEETPARVNLECPFCSATVEALVTCRQARHFDTVDPYNYFVRCGMCAAEGPWGKSVGRAEKSWDRRG